MWLFRVVYLERLPFYDFYKFLLTFFYTFFEPGSCVSTLPQTRDVAEVLTLPARAEITGVQKPGIEARASCMLGKLGKLSSHWAFACGLVLWKVL